MARLRWLAALALTAAMVSTYSLPCERESSMPCCPGTTVTPVMACCGLAATSQSAARVASDAAKPVLTLAAQAVPLLQHSFEATASSFGGRVAPAYRGAPIVLRI